VNNSNELDNLFGGMLSRSQDFKGKDFWRIAGIWVIDRDLIHPNRE